MTITAAADGSALGNPGPAGWGVVLIAPDGVTESDHYGFIGPGTNQIAEITAALVNASGGRDVVVDGEIVALDATGRPSFSLLQRRMHTPRPGRRLLTDVPAAFYLFDLLELDGSDVAPLPYLERRELLDTSLTSTGADAMRR